MAEEKYYKLVDEDGKHLYPVEDSEGEVWGLFGDDENNQARGAARFVEVDEDEVFGYENTFDYEWQSDEEPLIDDGDVIDVIFTVIMGALYLAGIIAEIVDETPEIIDGAKLVGSRIKEWGQDIKNRVVEFSNSHFKVKLFNLKKNKPSDNEVVKMTTDIIDSALQTKETISEEEAKKLAIEMLTYYAELKKIYDRLKAANIEGFGILQLEMDELLKRIDSVIEMQPQLPDRSMMMHIIPIIDQLPETDRDLIYERFHVVPSDDLKSSVVLDYTEPQKRVKSIRVKVVGE